MNDLELFKEILKRFTLQYSLKIEYSEKIPAYFDIIYQGRVLGGMNPEGFNLPYNLKTLYTIIDKM